MDISCGIALWVIDYRGVHWLCHWVCVFVCCCYSEKDYTDAMSDDEALSGLGSVSEEIEGMTVGVFLCLCQESLMSITLESSLCLKMAGRPSVCSFALTRCV